MAEWVQKGNLKGPQGDPGQDAQLPEGGTDGQVLTKTADGEAWQDIPSPEGMLTISGTDNDLMSGGSRAEWLTVGSSDAKVKIMESQSGGVAVTGVARLILTGSSGGEISFSSRPSISMGSKTITSITDSISASPAGNALTTDKAVSAYISSLIATDEEFDTFMGLS